MNAKFAPSATPIKLYRSPMSGHCHRVELMMSFLDIPYTTIDLDMMNGAHKAPEFLELSPFGQVPAIDDNGTTLSDSNAILVYLVQKYGTDYAWMPTDPVKAAEVQRWLSVAAGDIFAGPCVARLVKLFGMSFDYDVAKTKTVTLFALLEPMLVKRDFLAGTAITIADVAGYSYIAHAPEGGISLDPYPAIGAWLSRIEAHPGFVGMVRSPVPEAA